MLVLTRKVGQRLLIGDGITVVVRGITGKRVHLGIIADESVSVKREEVTSRENKDDDEPTT